MCSRNGLLEVGEECRNSKWELELQDKTPDSIAASKAFWNGVMKKMQGLSLKELQYINLAQADYLITLDNAADAIIPPPKVVPQRVFNLIVEGYEKPIQFTKHLASPKFQRMVDRIINRTSREVIFDEISADEEEDTPPAMVSGRTTGERAREIPGKRRKAAKVVHAAKTKAAAAKVKAPEGKATTVERKKRRTS